MSANKVKKHVRKKSCVTVDESIEHHQGSHHSGMFSVGNLEKVNTGNKASIFSSYTKTLSTNQIKASVCNLNVYWCNYKQYLPSSSSLLLSMIPHPC